MIGFGPWRTDLSPIERTLQLGRWQSIAAIFAGLDAPLTIALRRAVTNDGALAEAAVEFAALPPLMKRRILAWGAALVRGQVR